LREKWFDNQVGQMDFYLDFETLNGTFESSIQNGNIINTQNSHIFMIGVGHANRNEWKFKSFIMKRNSIKSEQKMFTKFYLYIRKILNKNNKTRAKFYHWSSAEVGFYNNFKSRVANTFNCDDSNYDFFDLSQVFINEPIVINGALNFSLKSVAGALEKHNIIKSKWDKHSQCSNGLNAMILAQEIYNNRDKSIPVKCIDVMRDIAYYNEIDCKVMWEIHEFMRNNL
jgi:predicted RecB family nuclease